MRSADWMLRSMQKSWRARGGHRMREAGIGCEGGRAAVRRRQVKNLAVVRRLALSIDEARERRSQHAGNGRP